MRQADLNDAVKRLDHLYAKLKQEIGLEQWAHVLNTIADIDAEFNCIDKHCWKQINTGMEL